MGEEPPGDAVLTALSAADPRMGIDVGMGGDGRKHTADLPVRMHHRY